MEIRLAQSIDFECWVELRRALWPEDDANHLRLEAKTILASDDQVCFLAFDKGRAAGFIEARVHKGTNAPYAHVEGWYVDPGLRRHGVGNQLMSHVEQWCLHRAIRMLTSDTTPEYPCSPGAHQAAGFRVVNQFTIFLKDLHS